MVKNSPNKTDAATNNITDAVCIAPSQADSYSLLKSISLYIKPITKDATTAKPAPSVAVTTPPKIPPKIITGSKKAKAASFAVFLTFGILNVSSTGKFFFLAVT